MIDFSRKQWRLQEDREVLVVLVDQEVLFQTCILTNKGQINLGHLLKYTYLGLNEYCCCQTNAILEDQAVLVNQDFQANLQGQEALQ